MPSGSARAILLRCRLQDHKHVAVLHLPGACHCKCVAVLVRGLSNSDMLVTGSCLASFFGPVSFTCLCFVMHFHYSGCLYVPVPYRVTFMTTTDELCGSYTYIAYSHGYLLQHHRCKILSVFTDENFGVQNNPHSGRVP